MIALRPTLFAVVLLLNAFSPCSASSESTEIERLQEDFDQLYDDGKYEEATSIGERIVALEEKTLGPQHPDIALSVYYLARVYHKQHRYAEAEPLYKRALAIEEKSLGPEHPDIAIGLFFLARVYHKQHRYAEAEPLYKRVLAIEENSRGPKDPALAGILYHLATLHQVQGRYTDAESLYKRALAIREKLLGPEHPAVARSLNNLANVYDDQSRYADAEPLFKRSVSIYEKALGPEHPDTARGLNNLATLYANQGRYADAESLHKRALAIREKVLGSEHPDVAKSVNNLALVYYDQGRYADAEPLYQRSLAIKEKTLGPGHPSLATSLQNLAVLYTDQARYADAERFYKRALDIRENVLGLEHPDVATTLNSIAFVYSKRSQGAEAERLYKRSLAIKEKTLGPKHPDIAFSLNNLAILYADQGRYTEAEQLYKRALAVREQGLNPEHPDIAFSLNNLAVLYGDQGHYTEAEPLYRRALAIRRKALDPEHPDLAQNFNNLAGMSYGQGRYVEALQWIRRGTKIFRQRFTGLDTNESKGLSSEQHSEQLQFIGHIDIALHAEQTSDRSALESEAFEVLQLARASSAAGAIAQMAARFASGDNEIATLVRTQQDALAYYAKLDEDLNKALGQPTDQQDSHRLGIIRRDIGATKQRLKELKTTIEKAFPQYASLVSREPLTMTDTQALLKEDEALIAPIRSWDGNQTHVFIIRKDRSIAYTVDLSVETLEEQVKTLRKGVDSTNVYGLEDIPAFDVEVAYDLYQKLLGPGEALLSDVKHLFVVPSGALGSLPLGVLVTEQPKIPQTLADYRHIAWLYKDYAITTLPSVASLKALRVFAQKASAEAPFIGFGDPVLGGEKGATRGINVASFFRGAIADVEKVRDLPNLPATNQELKALARSLGASNDDLYLGEAATETKVKAVTLNNSQVVAFATHGLISGDIKGLAEPALVLTPPDKGTRHDDGLLTASEVAKLKLNAEWVVLSACNTAAADKPGAEGLSGLAKAFFYAGTRALLVSHWPVESNSATELTTGLFTTLKKHPNLGKAEALRRSMIQLMKHQTMTFYSHPLFWAPFVVVGEGG